EQQTSKAAIRRELLILADCYKTIDWRLVLKILLDTNKPKSVRIKAAEIIGEIGEPAAIEPLKHHPFGNSVISRKVEESVAQIHQRHFTRECPFCAEIIKKRAKICKHCGKLLPFH
ncbi:MAG: zinc ribbon domain-containing protein, partial [Desulfobacterales bacterium]